MPKPTTAIALLAALSTLHPVAAEPAKLAPLILPAPATLGPDVQPFVKISAPRIALTHVMVIDGAGGPAQTDRTIVIADGKIAAIGPSSDAPPADATVIDLTGRTMMPGIVGMHDHLFYIGRPNMDAEGQSESPLTVPQMTFSAPRLYLANGVTTMRTTGSVEPYTDLNLKRLIDAGSLPGPHLDVTGPYLEGAHSLFVQMHQLRDADDARETVSYWAGQGATSFKAYMNITRAELKAAIDEAHRRGLKITGHLCSITYPEAAALGIDNLEHGFMVNTQLDPGKKPDICPDSVGTPTIMAMQPDGPESRGADQGSGRSPYCHHLDPAGVRTARARPCAIVAPRHGRAVAPGARGLSLRPQPDQIAAPGKGEGQGDGLQP